MACVSGRKLEGPAVSQQFPVGLRVLVVDDDVICLRVLEQKLRKCMYSVTSCSQATAALNLLRERKGSFDIVLSDVHMPDMDGFKLLELVGLEMGLPVIMMSADGRPNLVLRGVRHGACDYLIKPIRDAELKNIWQHVIRKKQNEMKEHDHIGSTEDHDHLKQAIDDVEYASSANEGADEVLKTQKRRRDSKDEDDTEMENDDPTSSKKPRVVWSIDLHQQFVTAVNQLGIDKAVPKRILELMNVPGLTRENVASHLQKFRLYLKRLSGVAQQQAGLAPYCGPVEQNLKLASLGRIDFQALAASGQIPAQTIAALHAELLPRPAGILTFPGMDQRAFLHVSLQGSKCIPADRVAYGQALIKCSSNTAKLSSQPLISNNPEFADWSPKNLGDMVRACNLGGTVAETNTNMSNFVQLQKQQLKQSVMSEPSCSINVLPSCLVAPSQSSPNYQGGNSPVSVSQNRSFSNSSVDYSNPLLQSNNSSGLGQILDAQCKLVSVPSEFGASASVSSASSRSRNIQESSCQRVRSLPSTINGLMRLPSMNFVQGSSNGKLNLVQESTRNRARVGKGTSIPNRFAINEQDWQISNLSQPKPYVENNDNKVKLEPNMDLLESVTFGVPVQQQFSQNDLMSDLSD